jgi:hypothetical protein
MQPFLRISSSQIIKKTICKRECLGAHLVEGFDKMLKVIQRYFTCEGIFNMIYQYQIRLFIHFTGKDLMNIPLYLFRSMGKMADSIPAKSKAVDTSVFHSGLIMML